MMATAKNGDFAAAFDWAVVRLATYFPAGASKARLLFGTVSLLTKDRPRPISSQDVDRHPVGKGKRGTVFFKRTVLTAEEAITWYREAGPDGIATPVPTAATEIEELDGQALSPSSFEDDPEWPFLAIPLGSDLFSSAGGPGDPAPFSGIGSPRIHRRFGDNDGFEALLADPAAISFLKRRLHVNLADYTEYLGGLALIVPDPVLRHVQHFLVPADGDGGTERLVYRLVPRPGQSLRDLTLTILERRSNLLSRFETVEVPESGLVTVESGLPFDQTGYAISHPSQGLLAYQQPLPFIRKVVASVGVAGRKVKVQSRRTESLRSEIDSYEFNEYAHEIPIDVGEPPQEAVVTVAEAEQRRIRRAAAARYKQTWFDDGDRVEALNFLRGQIARARSFVLVADPYFGALQIYQFLQAVPRTQIDFTILTSRLAFESQRADASDMPEAVGSGQADALGGTRIPVGELEKISVFESSLGELKGRGMKSVKALVLTGKTPPLHDRFLAIDGEVLFLGNSLNALGERASLILSVPDALSFDTYAAQRRNASPSPAREI
jgi:hypothetical protein